MSAAKNRQKFDFLALVALLLVAVFAVVSTAVLSVQNGLENSQTVGAGVSSPRSLPI